MDIADRIVQLRKEKNYSTTKLAKLAGIAQSTLREIELGKTSPTWDTILKLCRALGVSPRELLDFEPDDRGDLPHDFKRFLEVARLLTPRQRELILEVMEEWVEYNRIKAK